MAIIGNIYKLEKLFADKELKHVFNYLKQALNEKSNVHKRIFKLRESSFEKISLEDDIYALEQVSYTKKRTDCFIESHKKYIDFQLILEGIEEMEYIDIDKLKVNCSYNPLNDLITYDMVDFTSKFVMQKGDLAIFFPDDAHIGLPMHKEKSLIYKTIVKFPTHMFAGRKLYYESS